MLFLAKIAWQAPESRWPQEKRLKDIQEQQIVVQFSGALNHEGRYHFFQGTTLGQALESLSLDSESDISKLDLNKVLKCGQHVKISKKKEKKHLQKKGLI